MSDSIVQVSTTKDVTTVTVNVVNSAISTNKIAPSPVIVAGFQGLQGPEGRQGVQGPVGPAGSGVNLETSKTNVDYVALPHCTPLCTLGGAQVKRAGANDASTKTVIGFVSDASIAAGGSGIVQLGGSLNANTADWDVVTGMVGGLMEGMRYFLSDTPGMLTTTPPADGFVCQVGIANSSTELLIEFGPTIAL